MINYDFMNNSYREMPNDFVLMRHGESESNVVQRAEYDGEIHENYEEVASRPDWQQRLTKNGVKQAQIAGQWLRDQFGSIDNFDGCYVSPFVRARETASWVGGNNWIIDDRIVERFRGVYGVVSYERNYTSDTVHRFKGIYDASPWYARMDGAESLQDAFSRFRDFQDSVKRHHARQKVLVISHGDFIRTARYAIEWMLPENWHKASKTENFRLPNCSIVHYTRINPLNPTDIRRGINWYRIVYPDDIASSPNGGKWQKLEIKRIYNSDELTAGFEEFPRLIID